MLTVNHHSFQGLILSLQHYWANQGCILVQPLDLPVGAGTSHPMTFLRAIGPEPMATAYVQSCRRPTDGRYGDNPNRLQHYYQFQVMLKPSPSAIQALYLDSLRTLGLDTTQHDIRFVEDNWENPTLGAWGMGWEIWLDGMEISQFTYFQQVGGLACKPVTGEITYGLERLAMALQSVDSIYDLLWCEGPSGPVTYGDLFQPNEAEHSAYNFKQANIADLLTRFQQYEAEARHLLALPTPLPLPAYECILQAAHHFNLLDARKALSVIERQRYILRIRTLTKLVAQSYYEGRQALGFPGYHSQTTKRVT